MRSSATLVIALLVAAGPASARDGHRAGARPVIVSSSAATLGPTRVTSGLMATSEPSAVAPARLALPVTPPSESPESEAEVPARPSPRPSVRAAKKPRAPARAKEVAPLEAPAPELAAPAPVVKKQRWSRESTGHLARAVAGLASPYVAPLLAVHAPIVAGALAVGATVYAAIGVVGIVKAAAKAVRATPADGWWTPYDKTIAVIGAIFTARTAYGSVMIGGGIAGVMAGAIFPTMTSLATVGASLVSSGLLRSVMSIFMPTRAPVVATPVVPTATAAAPVVAAAAETELVKGYVRRDGRVVDAYRRRKRTLAP